jgi:hypothetical protein
MEDSMGWKVVLFDRSVALYATFDELWKCALLDALYITGRNRTT